MVSIVMSKQNFAEYLTPDLLANLVGVILRFRQKQFPISADIDGMYIQVSVRPQDRKFLRFLWGTEGPEM